MTVYDSRAYRDPMLVLQDKQEFALRKARQCGNCTHHKTIEFKGETLHRCSLNRRYGSPNCDKFTTTKEKP